MCSPQDLRVSNNQLAQLPEALGTLGMLNRLDLQVFIECVLYREHIL